MAARKMIKDLKVNERLIIPLVVVSATARKTKAGKDYLALTFYDGVDNINGNYWDWAGVNIPDKNAILNVSCTVSEWQGNKQLNINGMTTCTDRVLADFMPTSDNDLSSTYKEAYAMACDIKNDTLRAITVGLFEDMRSMWLEIPGAKTIHHAYTGGTLVHSCSVAKIAKAMAEIIPEANVDLCVAGALLHDIGKLFTYELNGVTVDMTLDGMLHDHIFIGANCVGNYADNICNTDAPGVGLTIKLLQHIILSHHGKPEYGSPVTPMCIEAYIVNYADMLDAAAEQIRVESRKAGSAVLTDKLYALNNRPHLTAQYVSYLLGTE